MLGVIGVSAFALWISVATVLGAINSSPQALNPNLKNTLGDNGGPTLYYNGSGPVPPYNMTSPPPAPLPILNR